MNSDQNHFLNLRHHPARLNAIEAGWYLGFTTKEIPHLTKVGLLKALGSPSRFSTKYYATVRLRRLRDDEKWLNRASAAIIKFWQKANSQRDLDDDDLPPSDKSSPGRSST